MKSLEHIFAGCAVFAAAFAFAPRADAHVGVGGPAFAGQRQILTFTIGHGCEGADTYKLELAVPPEVTSLRALPWEFGEAEVATSSAGLPLSVTWSKSTVRPADDQFYEVRIRITVPDAPFTTMYFASKQYCRTAMGDERVTEWIARPGEQGEEAAPLTILPARRAGWNKYTVPAAITDLAIFNDAQIVWAGGNAYSGNPNTAELIRAEPGVRELTRLDAGTEVWVKY